MKHSASIDRARIATPCPVSWEQMTGDDRVRFCDQCELHVYNISELTRIEAETLIASTEGRICARLYRRADGSVITKDCPVGLRALRMRVSKRAAAVFAALVSISTAAFGQQASAKQEKTACVPQMKITSEAAPSGQTATSVSGTVLDVNGAVIPGARVQFSNEGTHEVRSAQTTDEGRFQFDSLADGNYSLKIEATGFKSLVIEKVFIDRNKLLNISLILELSGDTVTMGVVAYDPLIDTTDSSIKTTITSDQIRRLPIPK
jgi:hypothetical protein